MTVVKFPDKDAPNLVWTCHCGCRSFELHPGFTECCHCGYRMFDIGGWYYPPAGDIPDRDQRTISPVQDRTIVSMNTPEGAIKRVVDAISIDGTICVIIVQDNGTVRAWSGQEFEGSRKEWLEKRFNDAWELLVPLKPDVL